MVRLFLVVALLSCAYGRPSDVHPAFMSTPYIIGGRNVDIQSYPHQVSLQSYGSHICGASIISSTKLVSAAHCTTGSARQYRIRAGSSIRSTGGQFVQVQAIRNHPSYCPSCTGFPNDISVITVARALVMGPNVRTIQLASSEFPSGQRCMITGWGQTSSSHSLPRQLQGVEVSTLSYNECANRVGRSVNTGHLCIIDHSRRGGACSGDSGGPLTCGNQLAGAASWVLQSGGGSCLTSYPSVYTKVSKFRSWILSQ